MPPPDGPGHFEDLLATFGDAASYVMETAGPRQILARTVNRFTARASTAPGLVRDGARRAALAVLCVRAGPGVPAA
jgi:hypothetical protein